MTHGREQLKYFSEKSWGSSFLGLGIVFAILPDREHQMDTRNILIIGNESSGQRLLINNLEMFGFHTSLAGSCEEARKMIAGGIDDFHLVIVDGRSVSKSEMESLGNIKETLRDSTPILVLVTEKNARVSTETKAVDRYVWKGSLTPSTLLKTISELLETSTKKERRQYRRYTAALKVKFHGIRDFLSEYMANIRKGGIYVVTEKSLPFRTPVNVSIELPDSVREVKAIGEVVYSVSPTLAEKLQRQPGLGIQFINFLEDTDKVLDEYFHDRMGKDSTEVSSWQDFGSCRGGEIHE